MFEKNLSFSEKAAAEVEVFTEAIKDIISLAFDSFKNQDIEMAKNVEPLEEVIDNLQARIKKRHVQRLREGTCTIELGFVLSDLLTSYERVADHCSNIAVDMIQIVADGYETHGYLEEVKHGDSEQFEKSYKAFKEKYQLPQK